MQNTLKYTCILALLLVLFVPGLSSFKLLMLPSRMKSHVIYFGEFGAALAEKHEVHMLLPKQEHYSFLSKDIKLISYQASNQVQATSSKEYGEMFIKGIEANDTVTMWKYVKGAVFMIRDEGRNDCVNMLSDMELSNQLKEERYDMFLMDIIEKDCTTALVHKLGLPVVTLTLSTHQWLYGVPLLPSITPGTFTELTDRMTFTERMSNLFMELMTRLSVNEQSMDFMIKYVPEKEPVEPLEFLRNARLWFYLYDPVLHYPAARMPNSIDIGDLMQREAKPLPKAYKDVLDKAGEGVILMTFGSYFKYMPDKWTSKFCNAFQNISPRVIVIWKSEIEPACNLSSNVLVRSWVPQNDLLGHRNLKLFITHGGWNSYAEAAYHATPMIAFPLALDQKHNAVTMQSKGLGKFMNIVDFEAEDLARHIEQVMTNASYSENAKRVAMLLREKEVPAKERINFWMEHVIEYGGDHLRSSGHNLYLFQFLMLDIAAFIFVVLISSCVIMILCCFLGVKTVRYLFKSTKTKVD